MERLEEAKPWLTLWEAINVVGCDTLPKLIDLRRLPAEYVEYLLITEGRPSTWGDRPLPERVVASCRDLEQARQLLLQNRERWLEASRAWHQTNEPKSWTRALRRLEKSAEGGRLKVTGLRDGRGDRCHIPAEQWCDLTIAVLEQVAWCREGARRHSGELARLRRRRSLEGCWTDLRFWTTDVLALRPDAKSNVAEPRPVGRRRGQSNTKAQVCELADALFESGAISFRRGGQQQLVRLIKEDKRFAALDDSTVRRHVGPMFRERQIAQPQTGERLN